MLYLYDVAGMYVDIIGVAGMIVFFQYSFQKSK